MFGGFWTLLGRVGTATHTQGCSGSPKSSALREARAGCVAKVLMVLMWKGVGNGENESPKSVITE